MQKNRSFKEVIMIGGGVHGSSAAYWIRHRSKLPVTVIEKDSSYKRASTALSVGSIRQQFSTPENIQLSQFSYDFLKNVESHLSCETSDGHHFIPNINFKEGNYMFLATKNGKDVLQSNVETQKKHKVGIRTLNKAELVRECPWLNSEDIEMSALVDRGEGWLDPYSLLIAFRKKSVSLGARFIESEVVGIETSPNGATKNPHISRLILSRGDAIEVSRDTLVLNTSGPLSAQTMALIDPTIDYPVKGKKRNVFVVAAETNASIPNVLLIDPTGMYFRPEGKHFIMGGADDDAQIDDFNVDHHLFEEKIWPTMSQRIKGFDSLKVLSEWAGHYEYNLFDQNAFIGHYPFIDNLVLANGFSGHGLMHSPAVGRALSELILDGCYRTINLSRFNFERYLNNKPLIEINII